MNGCNGLEVIREARQMQPGISTVIVTANASVESSVDAFRLGAVDYLTKPFRADQVANALARAAANNSKLRNRAMEAKTAPIAVPPTQSSIVACSSAMKRVIELAKRIGASSSPALVTGEVGCGKETIIRYIHSISSHASGPFAKVNCEAVSEGQLAEVLFGKETATGEVQRGAIERAARGTLFLHRVVNLPEWIQAVLARAFQEREFVRVGGKAPVALDARIVASTSEHIEPLVRSGDFVDDLYCYLSQAPLEIPPLRRRREDIRPLMTSVMKDVKCTSQMHDRRRKIEFAEDAMAKLERYEWPGNVYELENFVRRAIVAMRRHADGGAAAGNAWDLRLGRHFQPERTTDDRTALYEQEAIDLAWAESIDALTDRPAAAIDYRTDDLASSNSPAGGESTELDGEAIDSFFENWDEFAAHTH
jgi:DNA-binding NtrC family response regulator